MSADRAIRFTAGTVGYSLGVNPNWSLEQVAEACAFRAGLPLNAVIYELVPMGADSYLLTVAGSLSAEQKAALMPPPAIPAPSPVEALLDIALRMSQDLQEYADAAEEADPGSGQVTLTLLDEFEQVRAEALPL